MVQPFDREAFIAAARAAATPKLVGVTLAGIGSCWVRPLTAGDWVNAQAMQVKLTGDGVEITPAMRMAIGLAQNLCGEEGQPIFDVNSLDHLKLLAGLPMEAVTEAMVKAGELRAMPAGGADPNA